jgi:hypothetical protein
MPRTTTRYGIPIFCVLDDSDPNRSSPFDPDRDLNPAPHLIDKMDLDLDLR